MRVYWGKNKGVQNAKRRLAYHEIHPFERKKIHAVRSAYRRGGAQAARAEVYRQWCEKIAPDWAQFDTACRFTAKRKDLLVTHVDEWAWPWLVHTFDENYRPFMAQWKYDPSHAVPAPFPRLYPTADESPMPPRLFLDSWQRLCGGQDGLFAALRDVPNAVVALQNVPDGRLQWTHEALRAWRDAVLRYGRFMGFV